jgi:hypothetical protein
MSPYSEEHYFPLAVGASGPTSREAQPADAVHEMMANTTLGMRLYAWLLCRLHQ